MLSPISSIKKFFAGTGQLPAVPPSKVPNKATSLPSFKTQVAKTAALLQNRDRLLANTDITSFRAGSNTQQVIRDFAASSPDLSATVASYLRVGIPETFTVLARDMDGEINESATQLSHEILRRVTLLADPSLGYNPVSDIMSLSEALGKELLLYGACSLELVLDKARSPVNLSPVSVTKLKFREEDGGTFPVQLVGGQEIELDIPTFFYTSVDQDLLSAYSASYLEPAIQSVIADSQFLNDLRKSMQRVIQPRLVATIVEEKVLASLPPDVANDPEKLGAFYNGLISELTQTLSGLAPEDALVGFDSVEFTMMTPTGSSNVADTLQAVQRILESKLAAGAKTLPAILGRDSTGSAATTSAMLFLKNADLIRRKLNNLYSRALTQAVRLMGQDCFVEFTFSDLDLRPKGELEAYASMKQSRVLELLSLGLMSDAEACIALTGNLPPTGMKPLSGTMFKMNQPAANTNANAASQTSNMGKDKLKPETPAAPKAAIADPNLVLAQEASLAASKTASDAVKAMSDLTYVLSKQGQKPSELNLSIANEPKSIRIIRGEDGRVVGAEQCS